MVQKKKGVAGAMIEARFGLDHRTGHLASVTGPENQRLGTVKG